MSDIDLRYRVGKWWHASGAVHGAWLPCRPRRISFIAGFALVGAFSTAAATEGNTKMFHREPWAQRQGGRLSHATLTLPFVATRNGVSLD